MDKETKAKVFGFALDLIVNGGAPEKIAILPELLKIIIAEAPELAISWDLEADMSTYLDRAMYGSGNAQEIAILPDIIRLLPDIHNLWTK